MARPGLSFMLLLSLVSLLCAFSPSDYLYPNETADDISYSTFFVNSDSYALVSFKGEETFLLLNNETPINDSAEVESILEKHYKNTIYPSDAEIEEIYGFFRAFNDSRNAKTKFGPAEETCRRAVGLQIIDCRTLLECTQLASLICSLQGAGSGCDVGILSTYTLEYNLNLITLDESFSAVAGAFGNMTFDNIGSKLEKVDSQVPILRSTAQDIENSLLRFPEKGDVCMDCIGVCPVVPFNYTALNTGESRVSSLAERVAPVPSLDALSSKIADNTIERFTYKENKGLSETYLSEFGEIKDEALISNATDAQSLISDSAFNALFSSLLSKEDEIKGNINSNNFTGIEKLLSDYSVLKNKVNASLQNVTDPYHAAFNAKKNASTLLIQAEWRLDRNDLQLVRTFNSLKETQASLDYSFSPPLTPARYGNLTGEYTYLASQTEDLISSYKTAKDTLVEVGSFLGRNSVNGVLGLVGGIYPVTFRQREQYTPLIPPLLLLMVDFSFLSLATAAFVGSVVFFRRIFARRLILLAWIIIFVGAVLMIGTVSIAFYLLIDHASTHTTFSDFSSILEGGNRTAILITTSGCTSSEVPSISSCGSSVRIALEKMNKSVSTYMLSNGNCTIEGVPSNKTAEECMEEILDIPVISLSCGSKNETPSFFIVYKKEAVVSGDGGYFDKCDIAHVLE